MMTKTEPPNPANPAFRIPVMHSPDDAENLARQHNDPFYLAAYYIGCYLGELLESAIAEYADKKNPRDRTLQTGESWRALLRYFPQLHAEDPHRLFRYFLRFAQDDHPANTLRHSLIPLCIEQEFTGTIYVPKKGGDSSPSCPPEKNTSSRESTGRLGEPSLLAQDPQLTGAPNPQPPLPALPSPLSAPPPPKLDDYQLSAINYELTLKRWTEWLDSVIHLRTHTRWHLDRPCFDPDPEKRELAALGVAQRHLANLTPRARVAWNASFAEAAQKYKDSPKWKTLGQTMAADDPPHWPYAAVDTRIITLWPLVQAHNWTYRDLLNVIRPTLKRPNAYPCDTDQHFSTHCAYLLGLRKQGTGKTARDGRPRGWQVARELFGKAEQ